MNTHTHTEHIYPNDARPAATYSPGTAAEANVEIVGYRGGFAYVTFTGGPNRGITSKVPASWITAPVTAQA